jgi:hypothetical protein
MICVGAFQELEKLETFVLGLFKNLKENKIFFWKGILQMQWFAKCICGGVPALKGSRSCGGGISDRQCPCFLNRLETFALPFNELQFFWREGMGEEGRADSQEGNVCKKKGADYVPLPIQSNHYYYAKTFCTQRNARFFA